MTYALAMEWTRLNEIRTLNNYISLEAPTSKWTNKSRVVHIHKIKKLIFPKITLFYIMFHGLI